MIYIAEEKNKKQRSLVITRDAFQEVDYMRARNFFGTKPLETAWSSEDSQGLALRTTRGAVG